MLINHVKEEAKVVLPHAVYESSSHSTLLLVPVIRLFCLFVFHFSHWVGTLSNFVLIEVLAYFSMMTRGESSFVNCLFNLWVKFHLIAF